LIGRLLPYRTARRRARAALDERLRFETLLSGLSAGLIHVAATQIDAALEDGLRQVVAFLGVDRGTLDEYVDSRAGVRIQWTAAGVDELPRLMEDGRFPWTTERLQHGDVVRFSRTEELPKEAATDRASYRRVGTASHVSLPLRAGGRLSGVLSFDSVHGDHAWPDELVARLPLLGEAFANALERKRMELALAERLRFESLLSSLSGTFSNLSAVDFDGEVPRSLRRIVDFLGVERGRLLAFFPHGGPTRSWAVDDAGEVSEFPWLTARLQRGDAVSFSRIENLPDEADVDRQSCLKLALASQVAVPLLVGGRVVGGLVVGTTDMQCAWQPDELLQQLHLFGEIFANALSRREAELEAQRLRQDLAHVGRVSAMGELTASLAHELNQPLTAILNNAQAAQRFLAADVVNLDELREIVSDIVADDRRAAELIRQTRRLLRKGDLERTWLDLNETVAEVARIVTSDAVMRSVSMRLELADALPAVHGDRLQLQQVVLNLVLNGLDAMREPCQGDRTLVITTARDGPGVKVSVRDSGIGLDGKNVDRMFQPLYTTKAEGLGMGLAVANTIVTAHGGRLGASSNEEGGATFHFTLPDGPHNAT
jgi:signal transduction histidine kinase